MRKESILIPQQFSSLTEFLTPFITEKVLSQYGGSLVGNPWVWATDYPQRGVYVA